MRFFEAGGIGAGGRHPENDPPMEVTVDTTCSFIKEGGYKRKRWIVCGKEEWVPETFRFRGHHRAKEYECEPAFTKRDLDRMEAMQRHTPVLLMIVGSRHWWWFRGTFYHTTCDDPLVVKGLLLEKEARERRREEQAPPKRAQSRRKDGRRAAPARSEHHCPYRTLDVPQHASLAEIKAAYRKRLTEYHPDKVASLGIELRNLAEEMTKRINDAYEELRARHR